MRFALDRWRSVVSYVGSILLIFGVLLLIPFLLSLLGSEGIQDVRPGTFLIPMMLSLVIGGFCWREAHSPRARPLGTPEAMLICVFSWVAISAMGAIPFTYHLGVSYLDSYFEAMSGFTTTGITMLTGLNSMPKSLLFWRSMTQWVGGLGILTFFLVVVYQGGLSHALFAAETHKISGERIAPGMWNTLKILWVVYSFYTLVIIGALYLCGTGLYDAVSHAFTCLSTGGYTPYDASVAYYENVDGVNHVAIEYVLIFGMWAGGTNFLIHYRLLGGRLSALWKSEEMRLWWGILIGALALVLGSRLLSVSGSSAGESFRHSLFQVTAIATTTGYATRDIGGEYFTPLARQVFLVLMFIGGCAGSTGGGLKVIRIVILWKLMVHQVRRTMKPPREVDLLMLDGRQVERREAYRTAALFFAWIFLLLVGSLTTAALSRYDATASASGMFSALGNIGPSYIPVAEMAQLNPFIKIVYILGMLAGRLEILPVFVLFWGRTWD